MNSHDTALEAIWSDATNSVCQAMQAANMCNCPDGDCLAAKIEPSDRDRAAYSYTISPEVSVIVERLRSKMEGVSGGEWELTEATAPDADFMVLGGEGSSFGLIADVTTKRDAEYIAAASPAHVKTILEYLKQVEEDRGYWKTEAAGETVKLAFRDKQIGGLIARAETAEASLTLAQEENERLRALINDPDDGMIEAGEEAIAARRNWGTQIYAADIWRSMAATLSTTGGSEG